MTCSGPRQIDRVVDVVLLYKYTNALANCCPLQSWRRIVYHITACVLCQVGHRPVLIGHTRDEAIWTYAYPVPILRYCSTSYMAIKG